MNSIKYNPILFFMITLFFVSHFQYGKMNVVTTYQYIGDITSQVGGNLVTVDALAPGSHDPHFITPKPSFIAKIRQANLLIINGGQLEIGWLPPVIRQSNNPHIQPGSKGFLCLMDFIQPIHAQDHVSRAQGDVHPEGNPHFHLDPHFIPILAKAISDKLIALDRPNSTIYLKNYQTFLAKWQQKLAVWDKTLNGFNGVKVVEYHKIYDYLFQRYNIQVVGTLEPLPGIPPSSKHIVGIISLVKEQDVQLILQDVYHNSKTATYVAQKTGVKWMLIPHDIGAVPGVRDIFSLFEEIVKRLTSR